MLVHIFLRDKLWDSSKAIRRAVTASQKKETFHMLAIARICRNWDRWCKNVCIIPSRWFLLTCHILSCRAMCTKHLLAPHRETHLGDAVSQQRCETGQRRPDEAEVDIDSIKMDKNGWASSGSFHSSVVAWVPQCFHLQLRQTSLRLVRIYLEGYQQIADTQ